MTKAYDDGYNGVVNSFADIQDILDGLDNLLNSPSGYLNQSGLYSYTLSETARNYQRTASNSYYVAKNRYGSNLANYKMISRNSTTTSLDNLIDVTNDSWRLIIQALKDSRTATDYVSSQGPDNNTSASVIAKSNIIAWIDKANRDAGALTLSSNNISNGNRDVAQKSEALIKLQQGAEALDIKAQELAVEQQTKLYTDYFLRAPFDGVITKLDIKVGELASPTLSPVSMISQGTFQIESYVPEINIAGLKVGNTAQVTLDAYGPETLFSAKIISIDPAETIRDGVSTYKIKLQFDAEDPRIKSGMTANIIIMIDNKLDVIVVPPSAIFSVNGQKFVQVKNGDNQLNRAITIGSVGALGQAEVTSGLKEGDVVVLNPETK